LGFGFLLKREIGGSLSMLKILIIPPFSLVVLFLGREKGWKKSESLLFIVWVLDFY
jgi:hypothetical protein